MAVCFPHRFQSWFFRLGMAATFVLIGLAVSVKTYAQEALDDPNLEAFNVTVNFGEIGSYIFPAYYEDPNALYLPADELFDLFKMYRKVSNEGTLIKGYMESEDRPFEVNLKDTFILFNGKVTPIKPKDAIMDIGTLYLKTTVLKESFGFDFAFSFRNLTANFTVGYELPVVKLKKQEKNRLKLSGKDNELAFDTIIPRTYHYLKGGMLDWSVASTQSNTEIGETRMELGGGVELLGGETNIALNWSDKFGMNKEQQQYYWRWANNDARAVKQVQLGRVSSRSIATMLAPMDGFMLTNAPTTLRKALGTYHISDHTEPDWVIELYVNNVLLDYTRSDASGFYHFELPIVYGLSNVVLRFYGPGGEIRSEEKRINMPYNMLPTGELEYKINGGSVMDTLSSLYGRAEVNYGVARWLTAGAGIEYLSSITTHPDIPFFNFTFQPFSTVLITGEYAHNVRSKATVNVNLPHNAALDINFSLYNPKQDAIIYNYLQERSAGLSMPYRVIKVSGYTKASIRQNIYPNFEYNSAEWMVTGNYKKYNLNVSHFLNWTSNGTSNIYANVTAGLKVGKNINIRPSLQYNYSSRSVISIRAEMESKVFKNGYLSLRYDNNLLSASSGLGLTFRYDFPFLSTYMGSSFGNKQLQSSESAKGSFAFGSGNNYVQADKRNSVGRSGIAIDAFVDVNFNGVHDKGEPATEPIKVRCSGGQIVKTTKDSIIRIVGLEPFTEYTLTLDESNFQNLAWHIPFKTVKVVTDPNQFKVLPVAVQPMGEITGLVSEENGNGIGRILVTFSDKNGQHLFKTLTESDGYFSYVGFKPGDYVVAIDSMQLSILKMTCTPIKVTVKPDLQGDIVDVGTMVVAKKKAISEKPTMEKVKAEATVNKLTENNLQYFILFDNNKDVMRAEYVGTLQQLVVFLKSNKDFSLEILGHTDTVGASMYNQVLSERRAVSVMHYLIDKGVSASQLKATGQGEMFPVNTGLTPLERAVNRRVTFDKRMPGQPGIGATDGDLNQALMAAAVKQIEIDITPTIIESIPLNEAGMNQQDGSMRSMHRIVTRKKTRDMMFLELVDGSYIIQFGAFMTEKSADVLMDRLTPLLKKQVRVVHEGEFYKVQTKTIHSVENTVKVAKQVRISALLE